MTIANLPGISLLSGSDLRALTDTANKLSVPVDWLATVISFETGGTFSPSVLNKAGSGAFGTIQFLPKTAAWILQLPEAEAVEKGRAMSFSEQLQKMVIPYFGNRSFKSLEDLYLAVFYPAAIGKPLSYVVGMAPGAVYTQNAGFDKTGKGYVTKEDITTSIRNLYNKYSNTRINVPGALAQVLTGLALSALMYGIWFKRKELMPIVEEKLDDANTSIKRFLKG